MGEGVLAWVWDWTTTQGSGGGGLLRERVLETSKVNPGVVLGKKEGRGRGIVNKGLSDALWGGGGLWAGGCLRNATRGWPSQQNSSIAPYLSTAAVKGLSGHGRMTDHPDTQLTHSLNFLSKPGISHSSGFGQY